MDIKTELDDVALTIGTLMSKIVRRCRGDEIGNANRLPACLLHRMADEATDMSMNFLHCVHTWEIMEDRFDQDTLDLVFTKLIKEAAEVALKLEDMLGALNEYEAPLHIIRDKRIR